MILIALSLVQKQGWVPPTTTTTLPSSSTTTTIRGQVTTTLPATTTTILGQITTTTQPHQPKIAYLCRNSPCKTNENTWVDFLTAKGYYVNAKGMDSWTLEELRNYDVMMTYAGPLLVPPYQSILQAHTHYGIPLLEMLTDANYGVASSSLTIAGCGNPGDYISVQIASSHPVSSGFYVGQPVTMLTQTAESDVIRCYASSWHGTNIANKDSMEGKPAIIAIEAEGAKGRYVWFGTSSVIHMVSAYTTKGQLLVSNAIGWLAA